MDRKEKITKKEANLEVGEVGGGTGEDQKLSVFSGDSRKNLKQREGGGRGLKVQIINCSFGNTKAWNFKSVGKQSLVCVTKISQAFRKTSTNF